MAEAQPEADRLEVWFLDEARVGQTGRVCRRWFERGVRPRGMRDLRHDAASLFGAVCPERDAGVALVLPTVSAAAMQLMLDELGAAVTPGAHAVVLMDRAGWHIAHDLAVPANLTPLFLPAYSPRAQRQRAGLAVPARATLSMAEGRDHRFMREPKMAPEPTVSRTARPSRHEREPKPGPPVAAYALATAPTSWQPWQQPLVVIGATA